MYGCHFSALYFISVPLWTLSSLTHVLYFRSFSLQQLDLRRKQFHVLIAAIHELENILDGKTDLNTMFMELVCALYRNRKNYNGNFFI